MQEEARRKTWFGFPALDSLRAQLIARTMLPLGLLVLAFSLAGQIAYTQVTESLARSRDAELARVEAARVADQISAGVGALQGVANSPVLLSADPEQVYYILRGETLAQHFDRVQVSNADGAIIAASPSSPAMSLLNRPAFDRLMGSSLPMVLGPATASDGRTAVVLSIRYINSRGGFNGVVEGVIFLGSHRLGLPLSTSPAVSAGENVPVPAGRLSYLVAGDGTVLWHPDSALVGTKSFLADLSAQARSAPGASLMRVGGEQSIVGYAPLKLGPLLPLTAIVPQWVQWYTVTQERWADVVAPLNSILYGLLVLAILMMVVSVVLVTRSASTLTRPFAQLVAAARALRSGELQHRIEASGPTEISELAQQFNSMAEQLQRSYAELESKVEERTRELENANAELRRRLVESLSMQVVSANIAGTAELNEILRTIASSAVETVGTEGSVVFLADEESPEKLTAAALWNVPGLELGDRLAVSASLTGLAFQTGEPQVSNNTDGDARVSRETVARAQARSVLCVPLVSRGQVIGVIDTINKAHGDFTEGDLRVMSLLANQAAVAIERAKLYSEAQRQLKTLRAINELSLSITLSRSVEETLLGGVEHIADLLDASGAAVYLYDARTDVLNYSISYGLVPHHESILIRRLPLAGRNERGGNAATDDAGPIVDAFVQQVPHVVQDVVQGSLRMSGLAEVDQPQSTWDWPGQAATDTEHNRGALIALPLSVRGQSLGTMVLYFGAPRKFSDEDIQLYESFAKLLALAVHNSQLIARTSKLATVEERARLARELHDSVTQSLFSLNLTLRAATRVIARNPQSATEFITTAQDLAQGSLAEMRALIFELRPQALENEGLISALQKHADAVRARSGLVLHLDVTGERRLSIEQEEALYQIAREALHNVVKHAQATEAWVTLSLDSDEVVLSVQDNGKGFDAALLGRGGGSHIGTSTMRERAEAIGGQLLIESRPGAGSKVEVRVLVPLSAQAQDAERRHIEV